MTEDKLLLIIILVLLVYLCWDKIKSTVETFTKEPIYQNKPYLSMLHGFLSDEECDHIINLCEPRFKRSNVVYKSGESKAHEARTSSSCIIEPGEDSIVKAVEQRAAEVVGVPVENIEGLQVVKYTPGQQYKAHNDWLSDQKNMKNQRYATIFGYLNDDFEGGETKFTNIGVDVKPKKGDAALWYNCESNDTKTCYEESKHAGSPPTKGTKYGLNIWIRFNKYR